MRPLWHGQAYVLLAAVVASGAGSCRTEDPAAGRPEGQAGTRETTQVGEGGELGEVVYDVRRLRPRDNMSLRDQFEQARMRALQDGKLVAVLFSADWCESCRRLFTELGNVHPQSAIAHVRIFELMEEDWDGAKRLDEYNGLRRRWFPALNTYPILVLLDGEGAKIEEMREAIDRLEAQGVAPTVRNWFAGLRPTSA